VTPQRSRRLAVINHHLRRATVCSIIHTVSARVGRTDFGFRRLVAAGGYRSGSTLQYNLIGAYFERIGIGRRFGLVDPDDVAAFAAAAAPREAISVVKSHHAAGCFQSFVRPTAWAEEMQAGRARALTTRRDVAAVRISMMRKFGLTADNVESSPLWLSNLCNDQRWRELGAHEQTYELLTDHPVDAIKDACRFLRVPWSRVEAARAAQDSSLRTAIDTMQQLAEGSFDPVTLVHWDHVDVSAISQRPKRHRTPRRPSRASTDPTIGSLGFDDRLRA